MRSIDFIRRLQELQKPVFTLNDLSKITNKNKGYLKLYLFRLKNRGLIEEIERGKYTVIKDPLALASQLVFPSYISFLSAYSFYQLTTQMPIIIQVVASVSKKSLVFRNYQITFVHFPPAKIFGYHREKYQGGDVFIADQEKAVVDSLYLSQYCPLDETYHALASKLDVEKLWSYAQRMKSKTLLKRLGYLLQLRGIDIYPRIRRKISARYDVLNPFLKREGEKSRRWKLVLNERFEHVT